MPITTESWRTVFQQIARLSYVEWPAYDSTPLYDHTSLTGLESDVRIVSGAWFMRHEHISAEQFISEPPLAYFQFEAHDCYEGPTHYEMDTLFRMFVLKELHGWEHEIALYECLENHPALCERLGLETVPDQSTLWRNWYTHFTNVLRNAVQKSVRTIFIKAQNADVTVPRKPEQILPARGDDMDEAVPDDRAILNTSQSLLVETSAC